MNRIALLRRRAIGIPSIVAGLLLASSGVAGAPIPSIPDPSTSTVPPCLTICPSGDREFSVVVRDVYNAPLAFATVVIDLSNCPDAVIELCEVCQPANYDPETRRITRITGLNGAATFKLCGSIYCPSGVVNWARVSANQVLLLTSSVVTTDLDGDLVVDGQDVAIATAAQGGSLPPADQDCSGAIDGADVAIVEAHLGHMCSEAPPTILITEVEADPVQGELDTPWEWFELRNITGEAHTLTNWSIADKMSSNVLPTIALGPGECIVVAADSANFRASHPGYSGRLVGIGIAAGQNYASGFLALRHDSGYDVDCVSWGTNLTCMNPAVPVPALNTVATLQRTTMVDTDTAADWTSSENETPCLGTVGVPDPPSTADGPRMTIVPNPGFGHTTISCSGIAAGALVVTIHDAAGRRVRTLRDEGSGPVRNIAWNGLDEQGRAVPTGVYLVRFAAPSGTTISERILLLR